MIWPQDVVPPAPGVTPPVETRQETSLPKPGATILGFDTGYPGWVVVPLFLLLWCGLTYLVAKATFRYFKKLAVVTGQKTYQIALASLQLPLVILFLLLGIKVALDSSAFTQEVHTYGYFTLTTLVVITLVLAGIRIGTAVLFELGSSKASFRPLVGPTRFVINCFVVIVGTIMWMEAVDIPVTPVVATFGVVGLAAGLALWETLANLFAGLYLILDRRIRVGDFIRIQGAEEGFVESIGWRSIRLVNTQNDLIIVPNRRMAESVVTNFSLPQTSTIAMIEMAVGIEADVEKVTQLLQTEVRSFVKTLAGAVPEQIPLVRVSDVKPEAITFQIAVGIQNVLDRMSVQSELRVMALHCLKRGGVPPWGAAQEEEKKSKKKS